jgi:PleD family two-component response regulator
MQDSLNLKNVSEWGYLVNKILNNRELSTERERDWEALKKYFRELKTYFEVMGYELRIDEISGFAYIEEIEDMTAESLSKKQKLSYGVTLLLVILRESLYRKESGDLFENPYIITLEEIKNGLTEFLREKYDNDEKRVTLEIRQIINKTTDLGVLSDLGSSRFKINKILKARLNIDECERILASLEGRGENEDDEA